MKASNCCFSCSWTPSATKRLRIFGLKFSTILQLLTGVKFASIFQSLGSWKDCSDRPIVCFQVIPGQTFEGTLVQVGRSKNNWSKMIKICHPPVASISIYCTSTVITAWFERDSHGRNLRSSCTAPTSQFEQNLTCCTKTTHLEKQEPQSFVFGEFFCSCFSQPVCFHLFQPAGLVALSFSTSAR